MPYEQLKGEIVNTKDIRFKDFPRNLNGEIYEDGDAQMGWVTRPRFRPEVAEEKRKQQIKATAGRHIIDRYPEWKQRNMLARGLELLDKLILGEPLTPEEAVEREILRQAWAAIKAIRDASNEAEQAGTEPNEITWPS